MVTNTIMHEAGSVCTIITTRASWRQQAAYIHDRDMDLDVYGIAPPAKRPRGDGGGGSSSSSSTWRDDQWDGSWSGWWGRSRWGSGDGGWGNGDSGWSGSYW